MTKAYTNLNEQTVLTWTEKEPCVFSVNVKIPKTAVAPVIEEITRYVAGQAKMPGFRQGQAPVALIQKRFAENIEGEVRESILSTVFQKVQADQTHAPVSFGIPKDQTLKFEADKDADFTCEIEVMPEFKLPDYKALDVDFKIEPVTADAIQKREDAIRDAFGEFEKIEGALQKQDLVQVSYQADVTLPEDAPAGLKSMTSAKTTWVWLGDNERIPGISAAIVGKNIGDDFAFEATFPDTATEPFLAGKTLSYTGNIKDAQRRAALKDDKVLLERMGMKTIEDFKARVEKDLKQEAEDRSRMALMEVISEKLAGAVSTFAMPPSVIGRKTMQHLREISQEVVKSEADVAAFQAAREEHEAEAKKRAEKTAHLFFVLAAIAKAENIKVSQQEVEARIQNISQHLQQSVEQTKKVIQERGIEQDIVDDLLGNKVLDFLADAIIKKG